MKPENELGMIVAFYLSKFGEVGLKNLGFESYSQAFRQIGERLSVKSSSVKNWRDEFDPYYDNNRKGWYQRELRPSRQKVMLTFDDLSEGAMRSVVLDIITPSARPKVESELHSALQEIRNSKKAGEAIDSTKYIPRGPTGRMAEEFFIARFNSGLTPFYGDLKDRRDDGVGFDFEIHMAADRALIEIKGNAKQLGGFAFTDKEWRVANEVQDAYYLGLVVEVTETPRIGFVQNPAYRLSPTYYAYTTVAVNWTVNANQITFVEFS